MVRYPQVPFLDTCIITNALTDTRTSTEKSHCGK